MADRIMRFMPRLTEYLRAEGRIFTMREYLYSSPVCFVPSVGRCERKLLTVFPAFPSEDDVAGCVSHSGFARAEDWLDVLNGFLRRDHSKRVFLYEVKVLPK